MCTGGELDYHLDLGGSLCELGKALRVAGKNADAVDCFRQAIEKLTPLLEQQPPIKDARQNLHNSYWGRADALAVLGRHAEAVKDWDQLLVLNAVPAAEPGFRLSRALSLAHAGEHAKAFAEANTLAENKRLSAVTLYNLACVCALAAAAVKDDAKFWEQYALLAVELLSQAVNKGYKDAAHMQKDPDLDALRDREDFKKLVEGLNAAKEREKK